MKRFFLGILLVYFIFPIRAVERCDDSSDCSYFQICNDDQKCVHKDLFPILPIEIFTFFLTIVVTLITTVGGIGGGSFYLPIFMIFLSFNITEAIPLSIVNVMGVLLFRYFLTIKERHPRRDKPLINYEISILFCPSITVGTIIGVLINRFSPTWLILVFVLLFMTHNGYSTYKKALSMKKAENLLKGQIFSNLTEHEKMYLFELHNKINYLDHHADYEGSFTSLQEEKGRISHSFHLKEMTKSLRKNLSFEDFQDYLKEKNPKEMELNLLNKNKDEDFLLEIEKKIKKMEEYEQIYNKSVINTRKPLEDDIVPPHIEGTERKSILCKIATNLQKIIQYENQLIPWDKLSLMIIILIILTFIYLFRGSRNFESILGFEYCGVGYWITQFTFIPIGGVILFYCIKVLNKEYNEKKEAAYIFLKHDIKWDMETCKKITQNGVITGLISSILGIGGALIIGPLLLHLGFTATEATSTATFLALFTSLSTMIQYCIMGLIKWDYAFLLNVIGIVSMYFGMMMVNYIKKKNKQSLIVFILAGLIVLSTLLIVVSGFNNIINDYNDGKNVFWIKPLCTKK